MRHPPKPISARADDEELPALCLRIVWPRGKDNRTGLWQRLRPATSEGNREPGKANASKQSLALQAGAIVGERAGRSLRPSGLRIPETPTSPYIDDLGSKTSH